MKLFTKNNLRGSVLLSFFVSIILFSAIFSITYAETGVPSILSYQGRLTDSSGNLLGGAGTPYFFKFSFWDSDTVASGTQLWPLAGPSAVSLTVKQGVFNVNIGDTENGYPDILNYNFGSNKKIYLQVEASANNSSFETLSPRQRVTSAPFAEVAGSLTPDYVTTLLNSFVETDPIWNIASTSLSTANFATSSISQWLNDSGYLTAFTESDPLFMAASSSLPYQSPGSYLTSFTELDPIWSASSWSTTTNNSTNWNTAFSWGNHAGLYDLLGSATTTASSTLANWLALNPTSGTNTGDNAPNSQYSGLAGSKQDALNGTGFVKVNGTSITYDNNTYLTAETDPLFTNWDKHAGISITESQISDLQSYLTAESDTLATITARGASTSVESTFSGGLVTSKIRPATDSTSAFQINKADGVTNIFNVDTTNGRVGIGTTSPTSPLMFGSYGTVTNPTIALPNGSTGWYGKSGFTDFGFSINRNTAFSVWAGGAFIPSTSYFGWASTATGDLIGATTDTRIYRTGVGVISIGTTSNNNAGGLRAANVALGGATIGSNALAVTGSAIISGNVGIGTSSPLAKLDITGTAGADDIFAISSSTNTRLFTVAASGNVGIGTITPNSKLSIKGATTREIRFNPDQGVTGDVPTGVSFGGFQSSFSWLGDLAGTAGSKQVIAAYNGTTNGWRSMVETENVAAGSEPNLLLVKTAGNVGIGTTSPTAVLHLKAGTATVNTAPLKFTSGVDLTTPEAGAVEWDGTRLHITQTTGPTRQDIAYLTDITAAAHPAVTLGTANGLSLSTQTLSLGLASSGVTGALSGTDWNTFNSKESVLTFSSGLTRTLNDVHNDLITGIAGGQTAIGGTGVTDILKLQGTTGNGAATFPAIQALVGNNGGTTALTILNNGKVGVGTANPGYGLDIQSSNGIKISTSNFTSGGGRPGIRQEIYDTPGGFAFSMFDLYAGNFTGAALAHLGQIGTYGQTNSGTNISTTGYMFMGSEPTVAYNNNTFRLYPNKNAYFDGNVGIGTSSPLAKLDITGTAGAADIFAISSSTNTRLFTVAASGKVGIGTITPTNMLEVGSVTNGGNVAINGTESAELLGPLSAVGWSLGTGVGRQW